MPEQYLPQVTPHINTIEDRYRDIVLNASTTSVHGGVSSKLQLHTNLSDRHIYSCGIAIVDGPFIRKKLKIRFHSEYKSFVKIFIVNRQIYVTILKNNNAIIMQWHMH